MRGGMKDAGRTSIVKGPLVAMAYCLPVLMILRNELCGVYGFRGSPSSCLPTVISKFSVYLCLKKQSNLKIVLTP